MAFLLLWEFTATAGIIDSFIFSSPSRIALCFLEMTRDGTIFLHTGVTLFETLMSFFPGNRNRDPVRHGSVVSRKLSEILDPYLVVLNSLPKSALAPLLIVWLGATKTTIIVAGMSVAIFGGILNLYTSFTTVDPGKIKLIYTLGGSRFPCACKSCASQQRTCHPQQHEGQHRPLPGGCDHRRISAARKPDWDI